MHSQRPSAAALAAVADWLKLIRSAGATERTTKRFTRSATLGSGDDQHEHCSTQPSCLKSLVVVQYLIERRSCWVQYSENAHWISDDAESFILNYL